MPSFLSILQGTGKAIKKAAPIIGSGLTVMNPAAGGIFNAIVNNMGKAEEIFADVSSTVAKTGPQKKQFVVSEFETGLEIAAGILSRQGMTLGYDQQALHDFIDAQAHALNCLNKLESSMKAVPGTSNLPPEIAQYVTAAAGK